MGSLPNHVPVLEKPIFEPRRLRVVALGAGFAGLTLAYKLKHEAPIGQHVDFALYEKEAGVGGTWYQNRYPGVGCDVPAHVYTFPFELNPDWSSFYVKGPEICEYIRRTAEKYQLLEHVHLKSRIIEARWLESKGKWILKIDQQGQIIRDEADVFVNGGGYANNWHWPEIKGLHSFKGPLLHTAAWDETADWTGKRVAVIGNGAAGIQALPVIQKDASHLTTYMRSPTWIAPNFLGDMTQDGMGTNFQYSEEQKQEFRDDPAKLEEYANKMERSLNGLFGAMQKDSEVQRGFRAYVQQVMESKLEKSPELKEKLIPKWGVGCRRPTPGDGYLEALQEDNVRVEFSPITEITPTSIKTEDGEEEFDMIVCATGFDASFIPPFHVVGRNGAVLSELWKDNPEGYLSVCVPQMPNYFVYLGPGSPFLHGPYRTTLGLISDYILRWVSKLSTQEIKSVTVKDEAVHDFNAYSQQLLKRMVWTDGCRSWYKNNTVDGPVTALYCGSFLHYIELLNAWRPEDFDIEYRNSNRFAFLGNGWSQTECNGGDLTYYLNK